MREPKFCLTNICLFVRAKASRGRFWAEKCCAYNEASVVSVQRGVRVRVIVLTKSTSMYQGIHNPKYDVSYIKWSPGDINHNKIALHLHITLNPVVRRFENIYQGIMYRSESSTQHDEYQCKEA